MVFRGRIGKDGNTRVGVGFGAVACALALPVCLVASAAAAEEVTMKVGGKEPVKLELPAASDSGVAIAAAAESGSLTAEELSSRLSMAGELPNDEAVVFRWGENEGPLEARVWDFKKTTAADGTVTVSDVTECSRVIVQDDSTLVLDMNKFSCPVRLRNNALIEVTSPTGVQRFQMANRRAPATGDDVGVALTLVDRWKEEGAEGARANGGASFYYSLSNLKTSRVRLIGNVSVLDMDPNLDFELGIGLGVLFKVVPLARDGNTTSFGIAAGVGYNLMVDHSENRPYTFIGFSMNFQQNSNPE
jgi:hypothetical protein